jgi:PleD family two-component response regulator
MSAASKEGRELAGSHATLNAAETSLVLLVGREDTAARTFERALKPHGYIVIRAHTGRQGLNLAGKISPDLVMIEHPLPDATGETICRRIHDLPTIRPSTPILVFTTRTVERRERLDQFRAGAWDVLSPPFDAEEVLARLERYVAAKRDADAALERSHVDLLTGCYNLQGLMKRLTELAADATRSGRGLGCVVLGPAPAIVLGPEAGSHVIFAGEVEGAEGGEPAKSLAVTQALARVLTQTTRLSDAVGRIGDNDFVIAAPGIDRDGAMHLMERLTRALGADAERNESLRTIRLRAGVCPATGEPVVAEELLSHATTALRRAQSNGESLAFHVMAPE